MLFFFRAIGRQTVPISLLNKPAGIAVHPSILHYTDSLANGVKYYFDKIGLKRKIRPINRLDLNTSGIIIFAKNEYVQECLIKQMENNTFEKYYIAFVSGFFKSAIEVEIIFLLSSSKFKSTEITSFKETLERVSTITEFRYT